MTFHEQSNERRTSVGSKWNRICNRCLIPGCGRRESIVLRPEYTDDDDDDDDDDEKEV